jgi:hypothetical protein
MPFLGQVHEVEEDGEGARDPLGLPEIEGVDDLLGIGCPGRLAAHVTGCPAQPFDVVEKLRTPRFLDHLAEERTQPADIVM